MTAKRPRQLALLVALLVVLALVLLWNRGPGLTGGPLPTDGARALQAAVAMPDEVRLAALAAPRPEPTGGARNPFHFRSRQTPAAPMSAFGSAGGPAPAPPAPPGPPAPAGPPPIALKFIGTVDPASSGRLAVLSDGRDVFYGREGDTIEGRYRILRIGVESIELARLDGTGRQVIRLSGS